MDDSDTAKPSRLSPAKETKFDFLDSKEAVALTLLMLGNDKLTRRKPLGLFQFILELAGNAKISSHVNWDSKRSTIKVL